MSRICLYNFLVFIAICWIVCTTTTSDDDSNKQEALREPKLKPRQLTPWATFTFKGIALYFVYVHFVVFLLFTHTLKFKVCVKITDFGVNLKERLMWNVKVRSSVKYLETLYNHSQYLLFVISTNNGSKKHSLNSIIITMTFRSIYWHVDLLNFERHILSRLSFL